MHAKNDRNVNSNFESMSPRVHKSTGPRVHKSSPCFVLCPELVYVHGHINISSPGNETQ